MKNSGVAGNLIINFAIISGFGVDYHFNMSTLKGKWYANCMFGRTKSLHGNLGAQVFANKENFCTPYPTISRKFCRKALQTLCTEHGVLEKITFVGV